MGAFWQRRKRQDKTARKGINGTLERPVWAAVGVRRITSSSTEQEQDTRQQDSLEEAGGVFRRGGCWCQ